MVEELLSEACSASEATAVEAWHRMESASCARRLASMVAMLDRVYAASGSADRDQWCIDNWAAVAAHVGAIERTTSGIASNLLLVGLALRDRLPKVSASFMDGLIDYRLVRAIVIRTANVIDPDARRALDAELALALRTWGPMSVDKTDQAIDDLVARLDPHALRRTQTRAKSRSLEVVIEDGSGMATVFGALFATDAVAFNQCVDALADTVCLNDPRTKDERRSDALGALGHADRLACLCGNDTCLAASNPPASATVIYVVAHHDTVNGPAHDDHDAETADSPIPSEPLARPSESAAGECAALDGVEPPRFAKAFDELTLTEALAPPPGRFATIRPAALMGGQFLPGAITRRAALNATLVKIVHPGQAPPERHYRPSKELADFVRCRDLTCRFPGCKQPATTTDVDHTIPYPYGPTQASNLKCLCRRHHLLKTFWVGQGGWRDRQLPDGTIVWTAPDGRTHTTTPGSRLLFGELCAPTAPAEAGEVPPTHTTGLAMPRRETTRAQDRLDRIRYERELNRAETEAEAERAAPDPAPPF